MVHYNNDRPIYQNFLQQSKQSLHCSLEPRFTAQSQFITVSWDTPNGHYPPELF